MQRDLKLGLGSHRPLAPQIATRGRCRDSVPPWRPRGAGRAPGVRRGYREPEGPDTSWGSLVRALRARSEQDARAGDCCPFFFYFLPFSFACVIFLFLLSQIIFFFPRSFLFSFLFFAFLPLYSSKFSQSCLAVEPQVLPNSSELTQTKNLLFCLLLELISAS